MKNEIHFSPDFSLPAVDYANQGNAILGIRGAGKTYTAMKAAEGLLDASIPIIVFDPIGVWQNLKIGIDGHPGYPIVVAGGTGSDIILTKDNAVDIVRAAMKDGVSLVINLHDPELATKATWIKIVQETVDCMLYENRQFGLRHIFLEEAAEFIPQRIMPHQTRVYAAIERLARVGRNVGLGITPINQRAEEINKSILEICSLTLMHMQKGKNSLKSIGQWLEYQQAPNVKEILSSLPVLKQGQCWAIGHETNPVLLQVSRRNTLHPDPKKGVDVTTANTSKTMDVSSFVMKLKAQLETALESNPTPIPNQKITGSAEQRSKYEKAIAELEKENNALKEELAQFKNVIPVVQAFQLQTAVAFQDLNNYLKIHGPIPADGRIVEMNSSFDPKKDLVFIPKTDLSKPGGVQTHAVGSMYHDPGNIKEKESEPAAEKLGKCAKAIFTFLATYRRRSFTKEQIGIYTGYSSSSGGFNNALSEIRGQGMITTVNGRLAWNPEYAVNMKRLDYDPDVYTHRLSKCEREIYELLLKSPRVSYSKEDIAHNTPSKYSSSSGGFNNALSRLKTLELIKRSVGSISLHPEIVDIIKNIY